MPELPEMETYRQLLTPRLTGKAITNVLIDREKSVNLPADEFRRAITGLRVLGVSRRAKHLLIHLDRDLVLVLHLMLGGAMVWGPPQDRPDRTVQVELVFGPESLYFIGLRLGYLHLYRSREADAHLEKLGPEPLDPSFGEKELRHALGRKRGYLKPALVDQGVLSGIGNCYSDEICFAAGILPQRRMESMDDADWSRFYSSMKSTLAEAVSFGGYMDVPLFRGDTLTGGFDERCRVYDREGEPCPRCGTLIARVDFASKKSYSCPGCQH